jgi:hypothetical protein
VAGAAEELEGAEGREAGRQQRPEAGGVARGYGCQGKLAGGNDAQGVSGQLCSATLSPVAGFELEAQLGEAGDSRADSDQGATAGIGIAHDPGIYADAGRECRSRVAAEVWPAHQHGRAALAAGAPGGHQDVEAVDPAVSPGEGRDQPRIMCAAEAVGAERGEQVAGDVWLHGEYSVPGEGDDGL